MNLIDLEELIEQCNGLRAKAYIREAVDCYKIGAYRACIITTWVAVVYDIVDKLRDLALTGDAQAAHKVKEFEVINAKRDVEAALKFEREILALAQEPYEFLSAYEELELRRLQEDRNRCAHPNLVREDEVFRPTPELARTHMRHAVDLVLKCPPVQGKAALGLVQKEVESQYFPATVDDAFEVLKNSPIARARQSLIKTFIFGALTSCLKEAISVHQIAQRLAALSAVRRIHPQVTEELLKQGVDAVFTKLDDAFLGRGVTILNQTPDLLPWLSEAGLKRFNAYITAMPDDDLNAVLPHAFARAEFRGAAEARIGSITDENLKSLVSAFSTSGVTPPSAIVDAALTRYEKSGSFDAANRSADEFVRPLIPSLGRRQLERIMRAGDNDQVRGSFRFRAVLQEVKTATAINVPAAEFDAILNDVGLAPHFPELLYNAPAAGPAHA
jgi:hypothetical protein